ncbi:LytR C-terminal domain-containing protein [Actinoplanes sp. NBRC 103695]|uniref:LytR C-terminal domain-containing protein n=1 Tax=Actinoplanes sp. NBRC 103695 TaxID=3032202 RepID=UPI002553BE73|nr:LytR C-terminal domain-containing protein [Actinoplanes sp. NBRC 103695]
MSFTRTRAFLVVALLAVAAIVVVVVALVRDTQGDAAAGQKCPAGAPTANIDIPAGADEVKLRVFNGTKTEGVADRVSQEFADRGFRTQPPAESKTKFGKVAIIRYGPKSVGAAQWIRAYFLGEADPQYNAKRTTDVIDIVIGAQYKQLATKTEVNQSLAQLSEPKLPPGACAAR